ncbi:syntenin-1 [Tribolium castaneum]|uniref:Syntenin-1-like Protein n=1 Tax=Tribolium castaneum TaxID=7070 RepID=D6WZL0_TRICA|nr:PREDICTED: syntenin-1 [Tribolium castaneum]XP_008198246.1 PREDICTED: syntenin-1 [Tribolium castaneum]XP_972815.1 PREDICTED: syntenin-1 [Tribolium castaneum]EFA09687.1 Syntenin-1-like Protein [Tribolium castaneum]|eukprot:XP_008198245.1 PREDICTED: syntenin-1 [Tribolium castaneum]
MSLYPSLEDMKIDQLSRALSGQSPATAPQVSAYPALGDFMGLELTEAVIKENMPEYLQVAVPQSSAPIAVGATSMIAPLSGQSLGLHRAQVTNGVRQLTLCKDKDGKVGLRVKAINNGVFVCLVVDNSPAALAGLRFGDQILQINGATVAGFTMDKVHEMFKKSPVNGINVVVRDRPFERTLTLHKDSAGTVGFQFKNGKITTIIKDSSAARNGVLTDHQLLEVEGQNVVGLKDKQISKLIEEAGEVVTITVVPSFIYDHMVKKMAGSLLKDLMDHSVPNL